MIIRHQHPDLPAIQSADWQPTDHATLCFVHEAGQLLLMRKQRGLGQGKVNAPGGRIEPNETILEAAARETYEEVLVKPLDLQICGDLKFQFIDGYSLHCHVVQAQGYEGEPGPTEEAIPFWVAPDDIPYEEMWADDMHWLPWMLAGYRFHGVFLFDGDTMLGMHLDVEERAQT